MKKEFRITERTVNLIIETLKKVVIISGVAMALYWLIPRVIILLVWTNHLLFFFRPLLYLKTGFCPLFLKS